ncbi:MAG: molybdate ABC transporter substrate-binding protein [Acidimicrobiia bacterium]|nr:molybdate ABC transporter substrate-binding protein [Acidimicrobiia bacterium]
MRRRLLALSVVLALVFVGVACGDDSDSNKADTTSTTQSTAAKDTLEGEIVVSAAASLTEAFDEIAKDFETAHPGVEVSPDYGPSSGLSDDILAGKPSDIFASADQTNMQKLVDGKAVDAGAPKVFARNRPEMAVPKGNPGGVKGLADFAKSDLDIGLCAADVPCGKFARQVLDQAGITPSVDTNEVDVKSLLGKIESNDLDLGMVYHTDVVAAGDQVEGIEIPDDQNVIAVYPIAALKDSKNQDVAEAFAAYVASPAAQSVLEKFGFLPPS